MPRLRLTLLFALLAMALPLRAQQETFAVKVEGQGPPVVLIPGLSCSGDIWQTTVEHLKAKFQCHVISIKGFGGTPPLSPLPSPLLSKVRDEIIAYIQTQKLGHPVIIGHSLGGFLALDIGAAAPALPRGLVIVDAGPFLPAQINPDVQQDTVKVIADGIRKQGERASAAGFAATAGHIVGTMVNSPEEAKTLTAMVNLSDQKTVMEAAAELFVSDLRADIAKITCPVVVISAMADKKVFAAPEEFQARMQKQYAALTGVKIIFLPNSRHFVMYDEPQKFFEILDGALPP